MGFIGFRTRWTCGGERDEEVQNQRRKHSRLRKDVWDRCNLLGSVTRNGGAMLSVIDMTASVNKLLPEHSYK